MNAKILFLTATRQIAATAKRIAAEHDIPLECRSYGFFHEIDFDRVREAYDAYIAHPSVAAEFMLSVEKPVISLNISVVDYINAMQEAKAFGRPLTVICPPNIQQELEKLRGFIRDVSFRLFNVADRKAFFDRLPEMLALRDHTIVGTGNSIEYIAEECGSRYIHVQTRYAVILDAIVAASRMLSMIGELRARHDRLKSMVENAGEGILACNADGRLTGWNRRAEAMLDMRLHAARHADLRAMPDNPPLKTVYGNGVPARDHLIAIRNVPLLVNRVPGGDGGLIITMQQVPDVRKLEKRTGPLPSQGFVARRRFADIVGASDAVRTAVARARRFGATDASILIEGETGTGKELFVQSIHNVSRRKDGPFVAINCATLSEELLESELFGYEEGAFTGARRGGKTGLFELAQGGTLFLDEVSEIPPALQAKLLRVLQERQIMRLSGNRLIPIDVRFIAATNVRLFRMVRQKRFREDLYYRLNLLNLRIPPLRQRPDDIGPLAVFFVSALTQRYGIPYPDFPEGALAALKTWHWPGNVRELEHFVEKVCALYSPDDDFESLIRATLAEHAADRDADGEAFAGRQDDERPPASPLPATSPADGVLRVPIGPMKEMRASIIREVLRQCNGNGKRAADVLHMSRVTVWKAARADAL